MALRMVALVGLLLSTVGTGLITGSAQGGFPSDPHRISLGPDYVAASPGETVSYTVTVGTMLDSFSGAILVTVPAGVGVVGEPFCSAGCSQPFVTVGAQNTQIEASISLYGEGTASFSFQAMVDSTAPVGTSYQLAAYLLGGVNTAGSSETAYATLVVADTALHSGPIDNREAYLDITPWVMRTAPGGSTLYFVQPIFWGDWSGSLPDYTVEAEIPSGMNLLNEPICGPRQSVVPIESTCDVNLDEQTDGSLIVNTSPTFIDGNSYGIYLEIGTDPDATVDSLLQIDVSMRIGGYMSSAPIERSVKALVVDPADLSSQNEDGVISGLLELDASSFGRGATCSDGYMSQGTELALYEWGGSNVLASAELSAGQLDVASDGSNREVCRFEFTFEGVPKLSVYMVALMPSLDEAPCRSCILGLMTPGEAAKQVIVQTEEAPS